MLIDSNPDLIGLYETVRDAHDKVASELERLAEGYAAHGRAHYMVVRDERFNPLRKRRTQADGRIAYTPALAAMFIYLNRTGFNGLFRVNASGEFNVPPGRYKRPRIADHERLASVAAALQSPRVTLQYGSFESVRETAIAGDFVYFDPPYAPLTRTANFTSYTAPGFSHSDHLKLQRVVLELSARGCHVLASNSSADEIASLYQRNAAAVAAGVRTFRVPARRSINSNGSRRGAVDEFVITNVVGN